MSDVKVVCSSQILTTLDLSDEDDQLPRKGDRIVIRNDDNLPPDLELNAVVKEVEWVYDEGILTDVCIQIDMPKADLARCIEYRLSGEDHD